MTTLKSLRAQLDALQSELANQPIPCPEKAGAHSHHSRHQWVLGRRSWSPPWTTGLPSGRRRL